MAYTSLALLDLHARAHQSFQKLLTHCADVTPEDLSREFEGFGYPSIRMQLHHVMGAEEYWVGVLRGLMLTDERPEDYASIAALMSYRERVASTTADTLRGAADAELNTRRAMITWGGETRVLLPAHIIVRTQTHIFHHQGQVAAMCRLLGRPIPPGLDFPLT